MQTVDNSSKPLRANESILRRTAAAAIVVVLLLVAEVSAQEGPLRRPSAEPERAKLSFLVGSFRTETRILPGPMTQKEALGTGTSLIRWGLDSMFLVIDEKSTNPLLGDYKGLGLLGYDAAEKRYLLSMYNNFGDHPEYRGDFDGDTLVLTTRVPNPGAPFDQKLQWYRDSTKVLLRVLNDVGHGFVPVVEETATQDF